MQKPTADVIHTKQTHTHKKVFKKLTNKKKKKRNQATITSMQGEKQALARCCFSQVTRQDSVYETYQLLDEQCPTLG